jgi:hypothetical protein
MKSSIKMVLRSVPVSAFLFLVVLLVSCGGSNPTPALVASPYPLNLILKFDTSGSQTPPHYASGLLPAGSQVVLVCTSKDCVQPSDTSGNVGGPKILFVGTLTQDIPANTELALRIVSKETPVNITAAIKGK